MTVEELENEARKWAKLVTAPLPGGLLGLYASDHRLIVLSDILSDRQRRCVLAHEISHARHDDRGCQMPGNRTDVGYRFEDGSPAERRADMDAARMLIDSQRYAEAERACDGEAWLARELDVMGWTIGAYRQVLHDSGHVAVDEDDPEAC